jgi:hypothetical protein
LISASLQGEVYQFDLVKENQQDNSGRLMDHDFVEKQLKVTSAVNVPGRKHEFFAVGNDAKIHINQTPRDPYPAQAVIKNLAITYNGKALFAGVGDVNKPGCVIIYKVSEDQ